LLQTDRLEGEAIDTVFDLGAVAVLENVTVQRVESFLRRAEQGDARLIATSRLVAAMYRLTESERDILTRSASGEDRAAIALARASQLATVNKHIGQFLRKMGCDSLLAAVTKLVSCSFLIPDALHLPKNAHSKEGPFATLSRTTQRSTTHPREAAPRLDVRHDAIYRARSFS
jgi:DNA-binding CsgD family transcriptional regulator